MKRYIVIICIVVLFCMLGTEMMAQCPMCRMSAESNLANGGDAAKGLNKGILYLFALPYIMIFTLAYLWRKYDRKNSRLSR